MAVPKRRTSRSNTRHRRAQWKATPPDLVPVTVAGEVHRVPRALVRAVHRGYVDPATGAPR
ncbi:50S ribosomal protein L32 [Nocardioides lijunqiniae]|uniref:50S ribosomal protein L32 n=1 Tax=Nocardioides lijunqiniae TaxID=2760832 RepID=UPI0018784F03|nr:50S ribosomal protein L32 [Nocardioides lijunqiniae]